MAGNLLPVPVTGSGNRLPVLWVPTTPGGGPASPRLALSREARSVVQVPPALAASLRPRPALAAVSRPVVPPAPRRRHRLSSLVAPAFRVASQAALAAVTLTVALTVAGALLRTWGLVPVLTGSMRPGIQPGDLVLVTPEPVGAVRPGQVLDFQPPGEGGATVVHRVVSVTPGADGPVIRTKGDANNVADSWKARLGGTRAWRVRAVIPKLGYLSVAEHNPTTRLGVEAVLLAGGIAMALSVIWRRYDEEERRERIPAGVAS